MQKEKKRVMNGGGAYQISDLLANKNLTDFAKNTTMQTEELLSSQGEIRRYQNLNFIDEVSEKTI